MGEEGGKMLLVEIVLDVDIRIEEIVPKGSEVDLVEDEVL
jgi:hypothetical protein